MAGGRVGSDWRGAAASRGASVSFVTALLPAAALPAAALPAALLLAVPAAASEEALVWYRSGEGCPDAIAFLRKVERRAAKVRLAGQGDAIDFVVTLSNDASHGWGRVERQTSRGTVAIRELEAPSCEVVADGLALSLALAIDPSAREARADVNAVSPIPAPLPAAPLEPPPAEDRAAPMAEPRAGAADRARWAWRLGLQGGVSTLIHDALWGGGPFVELAPAPAGGGSGPAFRFGAFGTPPSAVTADVDVWLLGARLEVCPWGLELEPFELRPCAGFELGALGAERDVAETPSDTTLWGALLGQARAACWLLDAFALEAQAGLSAGLGTHEFVVGTPARVAARSNAVGFSAGIGASWRLP